ncbi:co-chaperone DjlA [Bowmanella pacifica]|uniref:Co-chaperone protein DjlA n=1 Tax=Bowmanella pacifica TaxID=502051 RepID=A0A917YRC4_9ALTE|nr:co-chaperone DjlA [Bowmanella pacifica]GGO64200.1 co-chaperone protein DjlA [Bowmanella pacifica]
MPIWGKLLGTFFGFMFGRIPGAILGFIVGHLFDKGYSQNFDQMGGFGRFFAQGDDFKRQAIFFHALFACMGHVAKASGQVTNEEIRMATNLMDQMGLTGDTRREAQQAFREGKAADFPLKDILLEFRESCHGRRDIMQVFLEILIQAAYADGSLDAAEQRVLESAASHLGFRKHELLYLLSVYEAELRFRTRSHHRRSDSGQAGRQTYTDANSLDDAYKILGVTKQDDMAQIKKAYRKLMAEHHPDKLVSKGLPKQAMEIAKNKAQDIQAAYELIRQQREK